DNKMFETVARLNVPYIMMHLQGDVTSMHQKFEYLNLIHNVIHYFQEKIVLLRKMGVKDIIIDPGFGFSKTTSDNFLLLKKLSALQILDVPILVGVSRKSMINKTLNISSADALNGTSVLNSFALLNGANVIRVHDVKEARECVQLFQALTESK
ncbi:MAG: dihydropteroate synthase, partial [Bacteroidia bacterium]